MWQARSAIRKWMCYKRRGLAVAAVRVVERLRDRGLLHQTTQLAVSPPPERCSVYVGFDPTADSLHIGNLLAIIALLHFQKHGYQPIAVIGGATGLVGDPSGRTKERKGLSKDSLEKNKSGIRENLLTIFSNVNPGVSERSLPLMVCDNAEWWKDVSAVDFVSRISRHFRLSDLLAKKSVKQRLESDEGMSLTEFLYPVLQSDDFLHLHRTKDCWIQIGGGDQWGNITFGVDYVKRRTGNIVHGITLPLLTTSSGEKFGKSAGNAVWLSAGKTSPYHLYQHFVQSSDQDVENLLKLFTFLELEEIQSIIDKHRLNPQLFEAQKVLAESVTKMVHGEFGVQKAKNATAVMFGDKEALSQFTSVELEELFSGTPCFTVPLEGVSGRKIVEVVSQANIFSSIGEAESMVRKGGLYVNFERVKSTDELFCKERHIIADSTTIIRIGKKQNKLIRWTS